MKLTSGFNFENYEITDYLGFCSGEYALNTKFLSDFNLLSSYSEKLEAAQKNALDLLISNAKQMGANAIIGLDIDYTTDDHDIMGVIANGTAVTIKSITSFVENPFLKRMCRIIPFPASSSYG